MAKTGLNIIPVFVNSINMLKKLKTSAFILEFNFNVRFLTFSPRVEVSFQNKCRKTLWSCMRLISILPKIDPQLHTSDWNIFRPDFILSSTPHTYQDQHQPVSFSHESVCFLCIFSFQSSSPLTRNTSLSSLIWLLLSIPAAYHQLHRCVNLSRVSPVSTSPQSVSLAVLSPPSLMSLSLALPRFSILSADRSRVFPPTSTRTLFSTSFFSFYSFIHPPNGFHFSSNLISILLIYHFPPYSSQIFFN